MEPDWVITTVVMALIWAALVAVSFFGSRAPRHGTPGEGCAPDRGAGPE